jgi:hypothetical protein
MTPTARAAVIPFDPDGGGADGTVNLGSMDFVQGSSLSEDVLLGGVGHRWTIYYQSSVGTLLDGSATVIAGLGLNSSYQITGVAAIEVVTTALTANSIAFEIAPNPSVNFFRMYYDTNLNANPLAGTGFNDGTLIMDSTANSDLVGFFNFTTGSGNLDQFNANNWPGVVTRFGIGAFSASAEITYYDPNFFVGVGDEEVDFVFANTSEILPFRETDPSQQFWDGAAFVPTQIGSVNGVDGPDTILQADLNASFEPVPEPASIVLWGLGAGLIAAVRFRKRKVAA